MTKKITFTPSNHQFTLEGNDSLLDAALHSGFSPNYGCNSGNCGKCKARLVQGQIRKIKHYDYSYTATEKNNHFFLQCAYTAESDLVLEVNEASSSKDIPVQSIKLKLKNIKAANDQVSLISLQTPRSNTLRFLAGQYINLHCESTDIGKFYIASCPCDDRNLQLHMSSGVQIENSNLTDYLRKCRTLQLNGPYGDFNLEEEVVHTSFLIAYDQGFAPLKSLIEHAIAVEYQAPIHLYRFGTQGNEPYLHNLCRSWADALDNFSYISTKHLSTQALSEKLLTQAAETDNPAFYLAGDKRIIEPIKKKLLALNPDALIRSAGTD